MSDNTNFLDIYMNYVRGTEAPNNYHRWAALSLVGTLLGRQFYYQHGHSTLYSNMYVMLMGESGARKSTAIKIAKNALLGAGFSSFSAEETSKQQFVEDLAGSVNKSKSASDILDSNLWGDDAGGEYAQVAVYQDEFNDFIGLHNAPFISLLGTLWDYKGTYEQSFRGGKIAKVVDPTVSILGGNTASSFARAFPPEIIEQGFFSRLLIVHSDPTYLKITFPRSPTPEETQELNAAILEIRETCVGPVTLTAEAEALVDLIYQNLTPVRDPRFKSYNSRRLAHLFKLCLIVCACHKGTVITKAHVLEANTYLSHAELFMPKALGQFGKGKNSDTVNKIWDILKASNKPLSMKDIWEKVHQDMEAIEQLGAHLRSLSLADKVFIVDGKWLAKAKQATLESRTTTDLSYLTTQEKEMSL